MSIRTTLAGLTAAVVLGAAALLGGSLATSGAAQAAPGWHGGHGHHGHVGGHGFHRRGHWGGGPRWGFRPAYASGYYGGCYSVLRTRFVPGFGYVERPVTRCR